MDDTLRARLERSFTPTRFDMFVGCDELLRAYGVTDHIGELRDIMNTPINDDQTQFSLEVDAIFKKACHYALLSIFIVPSAGELLTYHKLLEAAYTLENSFESAMIVEIIEDTDHLASAKEALTSLLEQVCEMDWAFIQESVVEVRGALIEQLKDHHENKLIDTPDEDISPAMPEDRLRSARVFFDNYPETNVQGKIMQGTIGVPADEGNLVAVMTPILYTLTTPEEAAWELIGMAIVLPITISSVIPQAKKFNNKTFLDPRFVMAVNLKLDQISQTIK